MPLTDWIRALLVVTLWGLNFITIKFGVESFSPFMLGFLRFVFVFFPACFIIPYPKGVPIRLLILYGMTISYGQFAFLFSALHVGMPAGISSVIQQSQAFFTILLATLFLREKAHTHNIIAILIALFGLWLIEAYGHQGQNSSIPLLGLIFTLGAALCFAGANIITKKIGRANPLSLIVWSGAVPIIPFFLSAWLSVGPAEMWHEVSHAHWQGYVAVIYLVVCASWIGTVIWANLISIYPVNHIAPLSLLIPVVGLISAYFIFSEHLSIWQIIGVMVVMFGLITNNFAPVIRAYLRRRL